jgi:hypothetical protein
MQERVCLVCEHHECADCTKDHGKHGLWVTCCQCGFGGVASFWHPEAREQITQAFSGSGFCQYCGHPRCEACYPDLDHELRPRPESSFCQKHIAEK